MNLYNCYGDNFIMNLGLSISLRTDFYYALALLCEALKEHGFGILAVYDVQANFKQKLDADYRPYKILGACNPQLASRAMKANTKQGFVLPCNITLSQEENG